MPLILAKQDMQALGSAITYARRYAWAAALGIAADEDDDHQAASDRSETQPARQTGSPAQGQVKVARSFAEWEHRMTQLSIPDPAVWAAQATAAIGGKENNRIMERLNEVLVKLTPLVDGQFPPDADLHAKVQEAFAQAFNGMLVDGPKDIPL